MVSPKAVLLKALSSRPVQFSKGKLQAISKKVSVKWRTYDSMLNDSNRQLEKANELLEQAVEHDSAGNVRKARSAMHKSLYALEKSKRIRYDVEGWMYFHHLTGKLKTPFSKKGETLEKTLLKASSAGASIGKGVAAASGALGVVTFGAAQATNSAVLDRIGSGALLVSVLTGGASLGLSPVNAMLKDVVEKGDLIRFKASDLRERHKDFWRKAIKTYNSFHWDFGEWDNKMVKGHIYEHEDSFEHKPKVVRALEPPKGFGVARPWGEPKRK